MKVWDVATRRNRWTFQGTQAAFSPDGTTLATANSAAVRIWEVLTGEEQAICKGHTEKVDSLAFSPDGRTLASGSSDGSVRCWDVATGDERAAFHGHAGSAWAVAFGPDGNTLASGDNETIRVWDVGTGRKRIAIDIPASFFATCVLCLVFSPDGKTLASGGWMRVVLYDVATGKATEFTEDGSHNDEHVVRVVFSPDGKTLASLGSDEEINVWDVGRGKNAASIEWGYHRPRHRLYEVVRKVLDTFPSIDGTFPSLRAGHYKNPLSLLFVRGEIVALGYDTQDGKTVKMWRVDLPPKGHE